MKLVRAIVLPLGLMVLSCGAPNRDPKIDSDMASHNIVAGAGEKSFTERYKIKITLPIRENDFLFILNRLKLHYSICGDKSVNITMPVPRQESEVDLSDAVKCYEIDGDVDPARHIGERYRAFLDKDKKIVYIENAFSYTGT